MAFSKETLKSFAQSRGISSMDDDALRILGQDLEYRLKEICQEASKFMLAAHRTKLSTEDINNALVSRNVEPLFGYDSNETLVFRGLPCNVYYVPDEEIDLEEYLERPLPKIPLKPYVQSHWLAIEGTQPPIQQNPVLIERPNAKQDSLSAYQEDLELKQQHKHLLTKELSMYFDKVLQTMETDPEIAIDCLLNETGIQQLVPYFLHHFKMEMRKSFRDEGAVMTILKMYDSLLRNKYIFIDPYLHEILPPLFSCVVGKSMPDRIRETASDTVRHIYATFSLKYKSLAPRIANFLVKCWLDQSKTGDSQYGALLCLCSLPDRVVQEHVVPNMSKCSSDNPRVKALIRDVTGMLDKS